MIDTTNTSVNIGRNEKQKAIPSVGKLDLRDYFAARAMQEMKWHDEDRAAQACYEIADAMLRARESK